MAPVAVVDPLSTGLEFCKEARQRGQECVAVWSVAVPAELKTSEFPWKATINHTGNAEQTVAELKCLGVEKLVPGCETGVELHAELADVFTGQKNESRSKLNAARRDKYKQGEIIRAKGLLAVGQQLADTPAGVEDFINHIDSVCKNEGNPFKAVVKPVNGGSSEGLAICDTPEAVREAFTRLKGKEDVSLVAKAHATTYDSLLCQEFLAGDEYVVDSVTCAGSHKVVAIWKYDKRDFHGVPAVYHGLHMTPCTQQHERLVRYVTGVLEALQITDGAVHSEVMMTAAGPVLVEANCRLHGSSGAWIPAAQESVGYTQVSALYAATFDEETFKNLPKIPAGQLIKHAVMVYVRAAHDGTISNLNTEKFAAIKTLPSYLGERLHRSLAVGNAVKKTTDLNSTHGYFLLCSENEQQVNEDYNLVQQWIDEGLFDVVPSASAASDLVRGPVFECHGDVVEQWKRTLYSTRILHLTSSDVVSWLKANGVGDVELQLQEWVKVWGRLHQDPRVPQRFSCQARCAFTVDPVLTRGVSAMPKFIQQETKPWMLEAEDIQGDLVGVPGEHTSLDEVAGGHGRWCQIPIVNALNLLLAKMIDCHEGSGCFSPPDCEQQSGKFVMNLFAARVFKDASNNGQPSSEGVHSDGNALTAILFTGRDNVQLGTGQNRVFDGKMPLGHYSNEDYERPGGLRDQFLIRETAFEEPFEFLIFLDRLVKHEGRPFYQRVQDKPSHRDVYLMFARSPKLDGSDSIVGLP